MILRVIRIVFAVAVVLTLAAAVVWAGALRLAPVVAGWLKLEPATAGYVILQVVLAAALLALYGMIFAPGLYEVISGSHKKIDGLHRARRRTAEVVRGLFAALVVLALAAVVGWAAFVWLPRAVITPLTPQLDEGLRAFLRIAVGLLCLGLYAGFFAPGLCEVISGHDFRPSQRLKARRLARVVVLILTVSIVIVVVIALL